MSASVADLIIQLQDLRRRLAAAAVSATRARAEANQAGHHYREAGKGSDHTDIRSAVADIDEAAAKSAKVARLLETARGHLAAYLNRIAPGSVSGLAADADAMPTGERLMAEAHARSDRRKDMGSFLSKMTRNVETLQDAGKSATKAGQDVLRILAKPSGPGGTQSTGTTTSPSLSQQPPPRIDTADAAGHLIAAGLVAGIAAHRTGLLVKSWIARYRRRDGEKRAE